MAPAIHDFDDSYLDRAIRLLEEADVQSPSVFTFAEVVTSLAARHPALVALDAEGELVGAVFARVDGERAWVLRWVVAPAHRRRGVGFALLRALERRLVAIGVRELGILTPTEAEGIEAAVSAGFVAHDRITYLEKRGLSRINREDPIAEVGGMRLTSELWRSIGGMENEKELIERRIILPLAEPAAAKLHGVVPASAIILFGPPGTGKTTFAKAIAGRLGWPFVEIFPSQLGGEDAHGRAGALRDLFERLALLDNCVAFIDEVEEIASNRQAKPETLVLANELLKLIPAFREPGVRLLVCATNSVRDLDHAFTRPGRFDYLMPVGPPDRRARLGIWQRYVGQITQAEIDFDELVERSQYFSAADIEFAARKAAQAAFERTVLENAVGPAQTADFLTAIAATRPTITAAMARDFEEDIDRYART